MQVIPLTNQNLAADIVDFDASQSNSVAFKQLYNAWLDYGVVRLRNQSLTDDELLQFSRNFGNLGHSPMGKISEAELGKVTNPYVLTISNIRVNGKPIGGLGSGQTSWHTDMSYVKNPPKASLLYALKVPQRGGETHFCCMQQAYQALPEKLKQTISKIRLKHDAAHDSIGKLRRGFTHAANAKLAPGEYHPIVKQHPETTMELLFLGRRQEAYVENFDLAESEALLDEIWTHVAKPEHVWTQSWQIGDLLVWDNRRLMHKRSSFDDDEERLMRRTQVLDH